MVEDNSRKWGKSISKFIKTATYDLQNSEPMLFSEVKISCLPDKAVRDFTYSSYINYAHIN